MGEPIVSSFSNATAIINQGFHQGNQLNISLFSSKDTICEGESININAIASGGSSLYTYSWSSKPVGFSGSNSNIQVNPLVSSWFIVNISDGGISPDSKDSIFIKVNSSSFNISFTSSQTSFTSPPFDINIQNQTPNKNHYKWMWNLGDGSIDNAIEPIHTYDYNGVYSINTIATDTITGCFDTLTKIDYISCSGGGANPCNIVANISPSGQAIICNSDSIKLSTNSYPNASYTWIIDGIIITGATDSIYYANESGMYQVMISDSVCSVFSSYFNLINYPAVTPIITSSGTITPCTNDSIELDVIGNFSSYLWSTGETSSSIFVNSSGYYVVSATDNNNCINTSDPYLLNTSLLNIPEVCIIGIDPVSNHNRIIWQRQNNSLIDSFHIYRESSTAYQYELIGTKALNEQSIFIDINSNPQQRAYRYKISAIDSCGAETPLSNFHKTNHLTINAGMNDSWNLIWDGYEGFSFGSYRIYRGVDSLNMQFLTQIQSTLTSFSDLNPPTGNVYYQIEVISPYDCFPDSLYKSTTNYNTSRSNTVNTASAPNTGIHNYSNSGYGNIRLYPNPNDGSFTIELYDSEAHNADLHIYNSMGDEVYFEKLTYSGRFSKKINLQTLSNGVYFVQLFTENNTVFHSKVIIHK